VPRRVRVAGQHQPPALPGLERLELGDHVAFLLAPETGSAPDDLGQLVTFSDVRDLEPGHEA